MKVLSCIAVVLFGFSSSVWGFSGGAPEAVCDDMIPKHPVDPQKSAMPYKVSASKSTGIKPGETIQISIQGDKPFKGFLLQVRDGDKSVGTFPISSSDKYVKTINCHGSKQSAATHKNSTGKKSVKLDWKAPEKTRGKLSIFATVAEDGGVFWTHKKVGDLTFN